MRQALVSLSKSACQPLTTRVDINGRGPIDRLTASRICNRRFTKNPEEKVSEKKERGGELNLAFLDLAISSVWSMVSIRDLMLRNPRMANSKQLQQQTIFSSCKILILSQLGLFRTWKGYVSTNWKLTQEPSAFPAGSSPPSKRTFNTVDTSYEAQLATPPSSGLSPDTVRKRANSIQGYMDSLHDRPDGITNEEEEAKSLATVVLVRSTQSDQDCYSGSLVPAANSSQSQAVIVPPAQISASIFAELMRRVGPDVDRDVVVSLLRKHGPVALSMRLSATMLELTTEQLKFEHTWQSDDDWEKFHWAKRFHGCFADRSFVDQNRVQALGLDFAHAAKQYGQIIITERFLPTYKVALSDRRKQSNPRWWVVLRAATST